MRIWKSIRATAAVVLILASGSGAAAAASDYCISLEARLAALERGGGTYGGAQLKQYDDALAKQQRELDRAMAEARRASCTGGFLFFSPRPDPKCGALMATIDRMRSNLNRLSRARNAYGGDRYAISRQRNDLLQALARNNCGDAYRRYAWNNSRQPGGFFGSLFGQSRNRGWDPNGSYYGNAPTIGTYRTLCVRTCDGYYFPISFSTVPSQFAADSQTCQAMCPGADVSLYVHRNPGQQSEDMVSLSGEPYSALPTAFKYRKEYDAACTCHSATRTAALDTYDLSATVPPPNATPINPANLPTSSEAIPLPTPRPSPSEDPETLANRAGRYVPKPIDPVAAAKATASIIQSNGRTVRVVGPSYYIAQ